MQTRLHRIYNYLYAKDPAFIHLKHGVKTLIALVIVAAIMSPVDNRVAQFAAGFAAGFAMQGIRGDNKMAQFKIMLLAIACYFTAYGLGTLVQQYPVAKAVALTTLGFFALYVRRFGPKFALFPIFVWIFCFLGALFPAPTNLAAALQETFALIIGFTVAILVMLFVFPTNPRQFYLNNLNQFYRQYTSTLVWLRRLLSSGISDQFDTHREQVRNKLLDLTNINQTIVSTLIKAEPTLDHTLEKLMVAQYALMKASGIMLTTFKTIQQCQHQFPIPLQQALIAAISSCVELLKNLEFNNKFIPSLSNKPALNNIETLEQQVLSACKQHQRNSIAAINLYLALKLIRKNILHVTDNHT